MVHSVTETITQTASQIAVLKLTGEGEPPALSKVLVDGDVCLRFPIEITTIEAHLFRQPGPKYPRYYPLFKLEEKWPPLEYFEHKDPGARADPAKPHLLTADVQERILSPYIGSELHGVQLSQLSSEGLDELALHVAQRKVVVLRDQDFKDIGPERQVQIASHFGPIHRHPTSGNIEGFPEFHVGAWPSGLYTL
jgi:sulfonate dioxygenase